MKFVTEANEISLLIPWANTTHLFSSYALSSSSPPSPPLPRRPAPAPATSYQHFPNSKRLQQLGKRDIPQATSQEPPPLFRPPTSFLQFKRLSFPFRPIHFPISHCPSTPLFLRPSSPQALRSSSHFASFKINSRHQHFCFQLHPRQFSCFCPRSLSCFLYLLSMAFKTFSITLFYGGSSPPPPPSLPPPPPPRLASIDGFVCRGRRGYR